MPYNHSIEEERLYRRELYARDNSGYKRRNKASLAKRKSLDPELFRWQAIWATYGLKKEEWLSIFYAQSCMCLVCGSDEPNSKKGWHTHHTGSKKEGTLKVHGILCHHCNVMLHKRATPELLRKLASFMETYNV